MSTATTALLVGLVLGSIFAVYVSRRSVGEAPIYGGALAKLFHFGGTLAFCMTPPTVITTLILHGGFGLAFPLGIGCVLAAFALLLVYAAVERPARAGVTPQDADELWTEEKARTSGL